MVRFNQMELELLLKPINQTYTCLVCGNIVRNNQFQSCHEMHSESSEKFWKYIAKFDLQAIMSAFSVLTKP